MASINWIDLNSKLANGDGPVLGREFEIAELAGLCQTRKIAQYGVSPRCPYCAADYYDPDQARFKNFDRLGFVSGP